MKMRRLTVSAESGALRLDAFMARHVPHCSRRLAQRVIAAGDVRVNGRRVRKAQTMVAGDVVELPDTLYDPPQLQPNPTLSLPVLYEDAALVAVDKPAGMPSHALRAEETDTAANFLLAQYAELAAVGPTEREAGLVHRLDTDTSGVLLAARSAAAYRVMRRQFSAHQVRKEYVAVVHGDVTAAGTVCNSIAHDRHNRRKMRVCRDTVPGSRAALTRYQPLNRLGAYTVLALEIPTGVMHQIRVHLASLGHPIVGDHLYGGERCAGDPPQHWLHAAHLTVMHPLTGRPLTVECAPPAAFEAFVAELREKQRASAGRTRKARH